MGLFDKEKLTEMANKAKETVKESWDEVKAEQERRKELGLLDDVSVSKLEYKGGHPALKKEKNCDLKITNEKVTINCGWSDATIEFKDITGLHFETSEQISRRVTVTRLIALNVFAFALKKKQKDTTKYLTIDFNDNGIENTVVIGGKNAQVAHSKLYERYAGYKKRQQMEEEKNSELIEDNSTSSTAVDTDPYEELKKLKELLDMGIINEEEFESKKKELLNL